MGFFSGLRELVVDIIDELDNTSPEASDEEYDEEYDDGAYSDLDSPVSARNIISRPETPPTIIREPLLPTVHKSLPQMDPALSPYKVVHIYEWPIAEAANRTLSLEYATAEKFRLMDCAAYCHDDTIRIFECGSFDVTPLIEYAAVSYVWKGNHQAKYAESFAMKGAEDGDRISLDVLEAACLAALRFGVRYIWLDRLCMMQTSKVDKHWQIVNMARIYKECELCLVLSSGIGGMTGFAERTSWIHRSWTLQEALLPKKVWSIFRWESGPGRWDTGLRFDEFIAPDIVMAELKDVMWPSLEEGRISFTPDGGGEPILSFLKQNRESILALQAAMKTHDKDSREIAIWRCALMRTSQREADVVYSIMGLFGVTLNPSNYEGWSQVDLTIALVQEVMRKGGRANWFGITRSGTVPEKLCTMPCMPVKTLTPEDLGVPKDDPRHQHISFRDSLAQPCIRIPSGFKEPWSDAFEGPYMPAWMVCSGLDWYLEDAPLGTVDGAGFIQFTAPLAVATAEHTKESFDVNPDGFVSIAKITVTSPERRVERGAQMNGDTGTHAVVIGTAKPYDFHRPRLNYQFTILMLIRQRADGNGWHKTGAACVPFGFANAWQKQTIRVGGVEDSCVEAKILRGGDLHRQR